jgi:regulator of sigma E protease
MIISAIAFIVVFTTVALAHEIGHFVFSRMSGIKVLELGLGFGPKLFTYIKNGTKYSLSLIPILGFVRIAGLDEEAGNEDEKYSPDEGFNSKTPAQRFKAIFGGPLFNLLLAFIIMYVMFVFTGVPKEISNEIATIAPASEAQKIGLRPGDRITAISGKKIDKMTDAIKNIHSNPGKTIILTIDRKGKIFKVSATPRLNKKLKIGLVGFSLNPIYVRTDPISALYESLYNVAATSTVIINTVALLLIGKVSVLDLAGPLGIAQVTGQVAGQGVVPLLSFTAFLSINLGILNLIPLPALDGGRLFFILLEAIRKKPIDPILENRIHQVGLILLLILMAFVTGNDLIKILAK